MIIYEEPDENGGNIAIRITEEQAIKLAKEAAFINGHVYKNDEDALLDFMAIHWAWKEPDKEENIAYLNEIFNEISFEMSEELIEQFKIDRLGDEMSRKTNFKLP